MRYDDHRPPEERARGIFVLGCLLAPLCFPFGAIAAVIFGGPRTRLGALVGSAFCMVLFVAVGALQLMMALTSS